MIYSRCSTTTIPVTPGRAHIPFLAGQKCNAHVPALGQKYHVSRKTNAIRIRGATNAKAPAAPHRSSQSSLASFSRPDLKTKISAASCLSLSNAHIRQFSHPSRRLFTFCIEPLEIYHWAAAIQRCGEGRYIPAPLELAAHFFGCAGGVIGSVHLKQ